MKTSRTILIALPLVSLLAVLALRLRAPVQAQVPVPVPVSVPVDVAAKADALLKAAFAQSAPDWKGRLDGDATMQMCSASSNSPSVAEAKSIEAAARASIKYPADGNLIGDWKHGDRLAQSGYGMRFTDYPAANANGGNCYACHQMTKTEVSYGTIGPSLLEYGKIRKFTQAETKAAYDKIYNSHVAFPCSLMPRFGSNGILTIEQVAHITALLMSPDSPVNQ